MKKEKIIFGATLLGLAVFFNEISAYSFFNGPDGNNIFCDIDPSCRKLNEEEIAFAKKYFGDAIDYRQVNLFDRPNLLKRFNEGTAAVSGFNGIYDYNNYLSDVKPESYKGAYIFIHELTHIWQYQTKGFFGSVATALAEKGAGGYGEDDYKFDITKHDDLLDFNLEQQGDIMAALYYKDYLLARAEEEGRGVESRNMLIAYICDQHEAYQAVVSAYFPVRDFSPYCSVTLS